MQGGLPPATRDSRIGSAGLMLVVVSALWASGVRADSPPATTATAPAMPPSRDPAVAPELALRGFRDRIPIPLPIPGLRRRTPSDPGAPGLPPRGGRPRPGSIFDPGAAGPGISQSGDENFLDGALDPRTGWPFVWFDHFVPRPDQIDKFWIVDTRDCPQEMGTDPWPRLKVQRLAETGGLKQVDPSELFAKVQGHPVLIQVQGSLTTPDAALGGMLWTQSWLGKRRALPPDTVVIAFDWPSQRIYRSDPKDIDEKGRRAYVAGFHLARFLQGFPASSRVCLLGQSFGGRVVPAALHLLGGGALNSQDKDPEVRLPGTRPDLHVRAVIIAGASDRNWLNPGERMGRALLGCEALLNLYNRKDEALRLYPFLIRSNHHRALGKVGLSESDFEQLGPLAARYVEHDVDSLLMSEHSLLDAVANPQIGRWIAPYVWAPDPGPSEPRPELGTTDLDRVRNPSRGRRQGRFGR